MMGQFPLAYLDPTAGSIGYQVLISGVLAAAATLRLYWHKVKRLAGREAEQQPQNEGTDATGNAR